MAELVSDCQRCGAERITFDVKAQKLIGTNHGWQRVYEAFCVCRQCSRSSIHVLEQSDYDFGEWLQSNSLSDWKGAALNNAFRDLGVITAADNSTEPAPEHLPERIQRAFEEGARCMKVRCFNAAGTMFRLCVDFATTDLLPPASDPNGPNAKERRDLGLRLPWLFANGKLPEALHELASCIKDDGNDGAHKGTLTEDEALDLLDFSRALLERLYTEPAQIKLAQQRRDARRHAAKAAATPANQPGQP